MVSASREALYKAIDELPDESLSELQVFVNYLHYKQTHPGSAWFRTLYDLFEPVREGAAHLSEEEINEIIYEAIEESRREQGSMAL